MPLKINKKFAHYCLLTLLAILVSSPLLVLLKNLPENERNERDNVTRQQLTTTRGSLRDHHTPSSSTVTATSDGSLSTVPEGCFRQWIGDGYCDDQNNNIDCDFDGGDCCNPFAIHSLCQICYCYPMTTIRSSTYILHVSKSWDPELCPHPMWVADEVCDDTTNMGDCYYDGGDCCRVDSILDLCETCQCLSGFPLSPSGSLCDKSPRVGDGFCDDEVNNADCTFDGGDCCATLMQSYVDCSFCFCFKCDPGWVVIQGQCMMYNDYTTTFLEANHQCQSMGGKLYEPLDALEYSLVTSAFSEHNHPVWIGITRLTTERFVYHSDERALAFSNWKSGEPSSPKGLADCVQMMPSNDVYAFQWNDRSCAHFKSSSICQADPKLLIDSCKFMTVLGDGHCDSKANNHICNYDKGDCCPPGTPCMF